MSVVKKVEPLRFPFQTPDPFLFAVYHNDAYPAGETDESTLEREALSSVGEQPVDRLIYLD